MTVFYIGYNSSAVLDMSQIRKPTSRWDVADRLPEKDIKVFLVLTYFYFCSQERNAESSTMVMVISTTR